MAALKSSRCACCCSIVQVLSGQTIEQPAFSMVEPMSFKVSAKIVSPFVPANAVPRQTIALTGREAGAFLLTGAAADGSFEFPNVPIPVSLFSRVLAEYREHERTSTTVIN